MVKKILVKCYFFALYLVHILVGFFCTVKYFKSKTKKAFLIGTPLHDNLGDHAIAIAEMQFIARYFSEYEIVEIPVETWRKYKINLLLRTKKEDVFFLTGGGNMGEIYLLDETLRRFIIKHFQDNKTIIFPQTVYFTNNKKGRKELEKTKRIYNAHKRLLICAREEKSFELMKEYFGKEKVFLCPDMVFSLEIDIEKQAKRETVGLCLREDIESVLSKNTRESIIKTLQQYKIQTFNTCLPYGISNKERKEEVKKLLTDISKNAFVITDRLHGAIFSVLVGVPCIAFSGASHKIEFTKCWLKNSNSLFILKNQDELKATLGFFDCKNAQLFDVKNLSVFYEEMADRIKLL